MRRLSTNKQQQIEDRCIQIGKYVVENNCTVRIASKYFNVSKSTVHKDLTERLQLADTALYKEVVKVLKNNRLTRHIRGGEATRKKYETIKQIT